MSWLTLQVVTCSSYSHGACRFPAARPAVVLAAGWAWCLNPLACSARVIHLDGSTVEAAPALTAAPERSDGMANGLPARHPWVNRCHFRGRLRRL